MNRKSVGHLLVRLVLATGLLPVAGTTLAADPVLVVVPEPGTLALITAAAAATGLAWRYRRK